MTSEYREVCNTYFSVPGCLVAKHMVQLELGDVKISLDATRRCLIFVSKINLHAGCVARVESVLVGRETTYKLLEMPKRTETPGGVCPTQ